MPVALSVDRSAAAALVAGPPLASVEIRLAILDVDSAERQNYEAMLLPEELARAGKRHFASATVEQTSANLLFQSADLR